MSWMDCWNTWQKHITCYNNFGDAWTFYLVFLFMTKCLQKEWHIASLKVLCVKLCLANTKKVNISKILSLKLNKDSILCLNRASVSCYHDCWVLLWLYFQTFCRIKSIARIIKKLISYKHHCTAYIDGIIFSKQLNVGLRELHGAINLCYRPTGGI